MKKISERSMIIQCAMTISLVQAISGAIYNSFINSKDPFKELCNPPGLLSLAANFGLAELVPLRIIKMISSSNHQSMKKLTRQTVGLPSSLQGVSKINISNLRNISGSNGDFFFDIEIHTNDAKEKNPLCICCRTKSQLIHLMKDSKNLFDKSVLASVDELKRLKNDKNEKEIVHSVIDAIRIENMKVSEQIHLSFLGFCPFPENNEPLSPSAVAFDVGVLSAEQRFKFDLNFMAFILILSLVMRTTYIYTRIASEHLGLKGNSLISSLMFTMTSDVIGRTQRREHLKNIEALLRWTRIVPVLSLCMLLESGFMPLLFFILVVLLRSTFDTCRMLYRIFMMDPTLKNSNGARSIIQVFCTFLLIPVISQIMSMLSGSEKY